MNYKKIQQFIPDTKSTLILNSDCKITCVFRGNFTNYGSVKKVAPDIDVYSTKSVALVLKENTLFKINSIKHSSTYQNVTIKVVSGQVLNYGNIKNTCFTISTDSFNELNCSLVSK